MLAYQGLVTESVGYRPTVGFEREIGSLRLQLQEACEILVAEPVADEVHHDLVHQRGDGHGHARLAPHLESELEVLAQQVTGEGWREIEIDERRGFVAAEGGPHPAGVEEIQVVRARDT